MSTFFSLARSRGVLVGALLYLAASLGCTQIPLLNYLGYEFSLVTALLGSFVAGFVTIGLVDRAYRSPSDSTGQRSRGVARPFLAALAANGALLLIPLLVMGANAFFVRNCSLLQGLAFFILLPVVSVLFASSLGLFCVIHYRHARLVFLGIVAATFAYALGEGYFTPAIFSYNFFYGYFPGLTYDEALSVQRPLILFRLLTLGCGAVLFWMARLLASNSVPEDGVVSKGLALIRQLTRPERKTATGLLVVGLALVWWFKCDLGFESTGGFIRRELGGAYETPHFTIVYRQGTISDGDIRWIAAEHEFRLYQVMNALSLPNHGHIVSYIYPSAEAKLKLIGAGNTDIAKPWRSEIHVTIQSLPRTLKHELVHVAASRFGVPVIRASLSTGLVEGLAMAVEWNVGTRTLHQYAAALQRFGVAGDIAPLMSLTGFATHSTAMSYVLVGSFCRYLIDRYGIRKMTLLYGSGDYGKLYGRSLGELSRDWQRYLERIPTDDRDRDAIDALFLRPTIFRKTCARVIAERNKSARRHFTAGQYDAAATLFRQSYEEGAGMEALQGWLTGELFLGRNATVIQEADSLLLGSPHPGQYFPLLLVTGDARWAAGEYRRAMDDYRRLACADITDRLTHAAAIRSEAIRDSAHRPLLLAYFLTDQADSTRLATEDSMLAIAPHSRVLLDLKGETLLRLGRYAESLDLLQAFSWQDVDTNLEASRLQNVGRDLLRLNRFQDARSSFWVSLNEVATQAAQDNVADWVERCEWMEKNGY